MLEWPNSQLVNLNWQHSLRIKPLLSGPGFSMEILEKRGTGLNKQDLCLSILTHKPPDSQEWSLSLSSWGQMRLNEWQTGSSRYSPSLLRLSVWDYRVSL